MAMFNYFYHCNKIISVAQDDGIGNCITTHKVGASLMGLAVRKSSARYPIGADRGHEKIQYTFHCEIDAPLKKGDKVGFILHGVQHYILLTSEEHINEPRSGQTAWKSYSAETYTPAGEVEVYEKQV